MGSQSSLNSSHHVPCSAGCDCSPCRHPMNDFQAPRVRFSPTPSPRAAPLPPTTFPDHISPHLRILISLFFAQPSTAKSSAPRPFFTGACTNCPPPGQPRRPGVPPPPRPAAGDIRDLRCGGYTPKQGLATRVLRTLDDDAQTAALSPVGIPMLIPTPQARFLEPTKSSTRSHPHPPPDADELAAATLATFANSRRFRQTTILADEAAEVAHALQSISASSIRSLSGVGVNLSSSSGHGSPPETPGQGMDIPREPSPSYARDQWVRAGTVAKAARRLGRDDGGGGGNGTAGAEGTPSSRTPATTSRDAWLRLRHASRATAHLSPSPRGVDLGPDSNPNPNPNREASPDYWRRVQSVAKAAGGFAAMAARRLDAKASGGGPTGVTPDGRNFGISAEPSENFQLSRRSARAERDSPGSGIMPLVPGATGPRGGFTIGSDREGGGTGDTQSAGGKTREAWRRLAAAAHVSPGPGGRSPSPSSSHSPLSPALSATPSSTTPIGNTIPAPAPTPTPTGPTPTPQSPPLSAARRVLTALRLSQSASQAAAARMRAGENLLVHVASPNGDQPSPHYGPTNSDPNPARATSPFSRPPSPSSTPPVGATTETGGGTSSTSGQGALPSSNLSSPVRTAVRTAATSPFGTPARAPVRLAPQGSPVRMTPAGPVDDVSVSVVDASLAWHASEPGRGGTGEIVGYEEAMSRVGDEVSRAVQVATATWTATAVARAERELIEERVRASLCRDEDEDEDEDEDVGGKDASTTGGGAPSSGAERTTERDRRRKLTFRDAVGGVRSVLVAKKQAEEASRQAERRREEDRTATATTTANLIRDLLSEQGLTSDRLCAEPKALLASLRENQAAMVETTDRLAALEARVREALREGGELSGACAHALEREEKRAMLLTKIVQEQQALLLESCPMFMAVDAATTISTTPRVGGSGSGTVGDGLRSTSHRDRDRDRRERSGRKDRKDHHHHRYRVGGAEPLRPRDANRVTSAQYDTDNDVHIHVHRPFSTMEDEKTQPRHAAPAPVPPPYASTDPRSRLDFPLKVRMAMAGVPTAATRMTGSVTTTTAATVAGALGEGHDLGHAFLANQLAGRAAELQAAREEQDQTARALEEANAKLAALTGLMRAGQETEQLRDAELAAMREELSTLRTAARQQDERVKEAARREREAMASAWAHQSALERSRAELDDFDESQEKIMGHVTRLMRHATQLTGPYVDLVEDEGDEDVRGEGDAWA